MRFLPLLLVVVSSALPFVPAIHGEFLNWDDEMYFQDNEAFRGLSGKHLAWMFTTFHYGGYYPVAWLSWALDYTVWGMDPFGFHLTNLVLHTMAAVAVWMLVVDLLPGGAPRAAVHWAAAGGALLFALHPLRVESVAWIVERRGILVGLFGVLSALLYLRAHRAPSAGRRRGLLVASVAAFTLSMLAKSFLIGFPLLLLLLDAWPLRRWPRDGLRVLADKIPFACVVLATGIAARLAQQQGGAVRGLDVHPVSARLAQTAWSLVWYPMRTVLPSDLAALHPLERRLDWTEPRLVAAEITVLASAVALWWWRKRVPALVVGCLAYALIVLPVGGLVQSGPQMVGERYSYTACVPFAALFGWVLCAAARSASPVRWSIAATTAVALAVLGSASWRYSSDWCTSIRLWERTMEVHPDGMQASYNLGRALAAAGRHHEALPNYRRTAALNADYPDVWWAIGWSSYCTSAYPEALRAFREAAERDPRSPKVAYGIAIASLETGQLDLTVRACQAAIALRSGWSDPYAVLGEALRRKGDRAGARRAAEQALALDPNNRMAAKLLAGTKD
ncbi:MAG: tetratricopeptide repeat protein [Planctomycetes bacterium]|nr:tetratricopeptide repeat protein [Planctomycetota bacterium]